MILVARRVAVAILRTKNSFSAVMNGVVLFGAILTFLGKN